MPPPVGEVARLRDGEGKMRKPPYTPSNFNLSLSHEQNTQNKANAQPVQKDTVKMCKGGER